jgi:hypothetical protein
MSSMDSLRGQALDDSPARTTGSLPVFPNRPAADDAAGFIAGATLSINGGKYMA